jgi:hypothetical protein
MKEDSSILRKCKQCGIDKSPDLFSRNIQCKDGLRNICKICYNKNMRGYNLTHPEIKKEQDRKYREKHRGELAIYIKKWSQENNYEKTSKRKEYKRKYCQLPNVKIKRNLSNRIYRAIIWAGGKKQLECKKYLGCTIEFLKEYIESLFMKGMTWDNYGEWHLDHIRPCASFDLTAPVQQAKCFHWSNLQPLWAHDNISKGAKIVA